MTYEFIFQLAVILFASQLAGHISVKLGQPSVLGQLLVGIVLGPAILGFIHESDSLQLFSTIGVIILMFIAGLETDVKEFMKTWKASTFVGVMGIILPLSTGYLVGTMLFGMTTFEAIFLGLLLSATSVSISVQALKEIGKLKSKEGNTILGAAVIDDVLVIILLAFVMSLLGGDVSLGEVVLKKVIFFSLAIFAAWKLIPWFLKKYALLKVDQTVITGGIILAFGFAYFAEHYGVAAIIGAYIAGIGASMTSFKHELEQKVETIGYSIFVPVFFASIGVAAQFDGLKEHIWLIVGLSVLAIATKLVGGAIGARLGGFNWRSSFGIGSGMVSRGEVALILASIGLSAGLLKQELFTPIVIVILVTTIVTPPMMKLFFKEK